MSAYAGLRRGGTVVVLCALLSGCGLYFHSDAYQAKTDAAADAVGAALYTPRVVEVGAEAIKASNEYEASIVRRELAMRDRIVAAVIKKPLILEPVNGAGAQPSSWYGVSLLEETSTSRLTQLVGRERAEILAHRRELRADFATKRGQLERSQEEYGLAVKTYKGRNLDCTELIGQAAQLGSAGQLVADVLSACQKTGDNKEAVAQAKRAYLSQDLSCSALLKRADDPEILKDVIGDAFDACGNIQEKEADISKLLFGSKVDVATFCTDGMTDPKIDRSSELYVTYCAIAASNRAAEEAFKQKTKVDAEIRTLAESYKRHRPKGVETGQNLEQVCANPPKELDDDLAFACDVQRFQSVLDEVGPVAKSFGYGQIAQILKDAAWVDIPAASAEIHGVPSAAPSTPAPSEDAALAGAVVKVVASGLKFGQAYSDQPPFDRAQTAVLALATLRRTAGIAEIDAQTERTKAALENARLEAIVREIDALSISVDLARQVTKHSKDPQADTALLKLPAELQDDADSALGAYVASVNRGYIPGTILRDRIVSLPLKRQIAVSTLASQSTDSVIKAASEALRAYGKGGMSPELVFAAILGALAIASPF